ncbi:MAG: hypothetical protein WB566_05830, partial [Terriglobales bacterium]
MRSNIPIVRLVAPAVLLAALLAPSTAFAQTASAQDDAPSLGDLARKIRKSKAQDQDQAQAQPQSDAAHPAPVRTLPAHTVIDNDNLAQVMEDAKNARPIKQDKTVFSIDASGNTLKVSSPDVTCSLSFNARASALLIKP